MTFIYEHVFIKKNKKIDIILERIYIGGVNKMAVIGQRVVILLHTCNDMIHITLISVRKMGPAIKIHCLMYPRWHLTLV